MVQKNKPKKSNKSPHSNGGRSKEKRESGKETSVQGLFKELNDPLYKRGYLKPESVYELYIVSRNWLRKFRRAAKTDSLAELEAINSDLLAHSVYGFEERKVDQPEGVVLRNNLVLDDDYEAVTDEAWGLLTTVCESVPVKKSFYVNEDYDFSDMDDSLFVNVMFVDKARAVHKVMLSMNKPRRLDNYYSSLLKFFHVEDGETGFLLFDSRKSVNEFEAAQKDSILLAKLVDTAEYFPYTKLKDHDVVILCANAQEYTLSQQLDENEGAYCYHCRDITNLYYHCSCRIVSYCSIECKYNDFLGHRAFCDKISDDVNDVLNDLKNYEGSEINNGLMGLRNIGNSCYLNCLLQAIKHNDLIKTHLASRNSQFINGQSPLTNALYHFFYVIWHSRRPFVRPWLLKVALGLKHKDYLYFEQNDAHECLMNIIDDIDEVNDPMYKAISQSYRGRLTSKITCTNCAKEIRKHENFYSLSLPLIEEKQKTKLTLNAVSEANHFQMSQSEEVITGQTILADLVAGGEPTVLYLADLEKISCVVTGVDDELTKILDEAKEFRNKDSFMILQTVEKENFIGVAYTELKPTANKFFDMRAKICRMRLLPIDAQVAGDVQYVLGQDIKAALLKNLLSLISSEEEESKELQCLGSESFSMRSKVAAKLLNFEPQCPVLEKPLFPKKHHFKIEKPKVDSQQKATDLKHDEFEYDKAAYEAALKSYEGEYKKFLLSEQDQVQSTEAAKQFSALGPEFQFEVLYINKADVCANCGKKMKHQCKFKADQKFPLSSGKLVEVNIEFPKNSVFVSKIKELTAFEAGVKPLNLSDQKAELSLNSCLDGFFSPERIDFTCEGCHNPFSVISTEIDALPDTLIIQFKRFATVFKDNKVKQVKNEQLVDFELALQLGGHRYDLCAVINHKGEINHGHYTSFAFNEHTHGWVLYDDETVTEVSEARQINSKENYILFFKLNKHGGIN